MIPFLEIERENGAKWRKTYTDGLTNQKRWELRHPDRLKGRSKNWRLNNPQTYLLKAARDRAFKKGLEFNLTKEDIVIPDYCPILKVKLVSDTEYAASIDRINPLLGYVKGNIQIISNKANMMKSNATLSELKLFAEWISQL